MKPPRSRTNNSNEKQKYDAREKMTRPDNMRGIIYFALLNSNK